MPSGVSDVQIAWLACGHEMCGAVADELPWLGVVNLRGDGRADAFNGELAPVTVAP